MLTVIVGLYAAGGAWHRPLAGLPDAGPATTWALPLAQLAVILLAVRVLGLLVAVAFLLPTTPDTIGRDSVRLMRRAAMLSALWAAVCLTTAVLTLGVALGLSAAQVASPGVAGTYLWSLPASRNFIYAAMLAAVVAIFAPVVASLNSVAGLAAMAAAAIAVPLLGSHAANLGDHSLAITSSVAHGLAASLWLGTLWAVLPAIDAGSTPTMRRFSRLARACFALLVVSGLGSAYARLDSLSDLVTTGYGRVVVVKVMALLSLAAVVSRLRRPDLPSRARLVAVELTLMGTAVGLGTALHTSPFSRLATRLPSAAEELLGYPFPPAPTVVRMVTGWHPDWLMLCLTVGLAVGYLRACRATSWHPMRTVSFLAGLAVVAWTTSSNLAAYAMVSFQAHMVQHMMLSMVAPILLVLGAPVSLALRALPAVSAGHERSPRRWAASLLNSRYARLITHPMFVLVVFALGLYGVYFTPAFTALMSSHTGHVFMELHFLVTGTLFAFTVAGVDPAPRQLPHWARLILVLVAMSVHAFFAVALMQATVPVGNGWYSLVRPPWIDNPLADTYAGGGVAWAVGEIPTLLLLVALAVQWARSDDRLAARLDRAADRTGDAELAAYNAHLADLHRRDNVT